MKKKLLSLIFAICLILPCSIMLGGCSEGHTHNFELSGYIVEDGKAYEVKQCECKETQKTELANYVVGTVETAQELLDNVEDGKTIVLDRGDYNTLYLRKNDRSTLVDSDWAGGGDATYKRVINGLTIIGVEGTNLKSLVAEAGTYAKTEHSLSNQYQYLHTYMDITNLTIKNVTFNLEENKVAVDIASAGKDVSINGLTIDGCTVNGVNSTTSGGNRLFQSDGSVFSAQAIVEKGNEILVTNRKNITIANCTLNDLYEGLRIYFVENLTVSNNTFNNTKSRVMMLGGGTGTIGGEVKIENNVINNSTERFIRMINLSGNLSIKSNVVVDYQGEDVDIVKITDPSGNDYSVTFNDNNWNGLTDDQALEQGKVAYP